VQRHDPSRSNRLVQVWDELVEQGQRLAQMHFSSGALGLPPIFLVSLQEDLMSVIVINVVYFIVIFYAFVRGGVI